MLRLFRAATSPAALKLLPGLAATLALLVLWDGGQALMISLLAHTLLAPIPPGVLVDVLSAAAGVGFVMRQWRVYLRAQRARAGTSRLFVAVVWLPGDGVLETRLSAHPFTEQLLGHLKQQAAAKLLKTSGYLVDLDDLQITVSDCARP